MHDAADSPNFTLRLYSSTSRSSQESRSRATVSASYMLYLLPAECAAQAEVQRA